MNPTSRAKARIASPTESPTEVEETEAAQQAGTERAAVKAGRRSKARARQAWREENRGSVDRVALSAALDRHVEARDIAASRTAAHAEPSNVTTDRWVPIGPSVLRQGQALDRPRVAGRVRDIAVDPTGQRAYAASANGGVWYTDSGGSSWEPVGPWAERTRRQGGRTNAQTCGAILVDFDPGGFSLLDFVMVATGEPPVTPGTVTRPDAPVTGGIGVLSATGPMIPAGAGTFDPWEPDTGIALLEGLAIYRLARQPGRTAGSPTGVTQDRVIACTTNGLFLGTRQSIPAGGGLLLRDGFVWTQQAMALTAPPPVPVGFPVAPIVTDAVWLAGGAHGRLVLAIFNWGLVFSDDAGATIHAIPTLGRPGVAVLGRMSLAMATGNRGYALADVGGLPTLWRFPDLTVSPPVATPILGVPAGLWGTQRDYDQAIAVDVVTVPAAGDIDGVADTRIDRIYLGGSVTLNLNDARTIAEWVASLWCFDVDATPALQPAKGVSRLGPLPGGVGVLAPAPVGFSLNPGLIGRNVHGDVHRLVLAGAAPNRQLWVTCDGGIFQSTQAGRVNTFAPVMNGVSTLEPGYIASHPTNSHYVAAGFQDNGTAVRVGDTIWEEVFVGDGGGLAFHPEMSDVLVTQWTQASWQCADPQFRDPMHRQAVHPNWTAISLERENGVSAFYCGASSVRVGPGLGRIALGTERVWVSDDIGGAAPCTWRVLPFPNGVSADQRSTPVAPALGADLPVVGLVNPPAIGLPSGGRPVAAFGSVRMVKWASPTELLAVFVGGICRWTETVANNWTATQWALTARDVLIERTQTLTDIAPLPSTAVAADRQDYYVTTLGASGTTQETVWYHRAATNRFHRTNFRHQLDLPGAPPTLGPLDPVYSVVVNPTQPNLVYVGTATGVWEGTRNNTTGGHTWRILDNGIPEAAVQDLSIWQDPAGAVGAPRLLRAGVQSRGIWELDLANPAHRLTYLRVHAHDDRRAPSVAILDPRRRPPAALATNSSPDIVVRPKWPKPTAPRFIGPAALTNLNPIPYELWTFQTAFRWIYPSVLPTGLWSDALGDLIEFHRATHPPLAAGRLIDQPLWDAVVGGTHLNAAGTVTSVAADRLAVYRQPWHTPLALDTQPTEIDLFECVVPPSTAGGVWTVYSEPSSVDVLLHHRDSRIVTTGRGWAMLLWARAPSVAAAMALRIDGAQTVAAFRAAAAGGAVNTPAPTGWNVVRDSAGAARFVLHGNLSARTPLAVSFDVDLRPPAAPPTPPVVVFLALVGSIDDDPTIAANGAPTTVDQLVRNWPYAAARVVRLTRRP